MTGAGAGIGRAIAIRLSHSGSSLALADINLKSARETEEEIGSWSGRAAASFQVDVTQGTQLETMVDRVVDEFGRIDVLVNNAGMAGRAAPLSELRDQDWQQVMDTNLNSIFYCCRAVIPPHDGKTVRTHHQRCLNRR